MKNTLRRRVSETDSAKTIGTTKIKTETKLYNKIADIQYDNIKNMTRNEMKIPSIISSQTYYSDQSNTEQLKWTLLRTPENSTYSSQFNKYITPLTLEVDTIIQLQK